jgi:glycosyltransferase involved in cell wall biosynthesis
MRISYAITAHNEHEELERLLNLLNNNIRDIDEVIIQLDTTATEEVKNVCYKYPAFTLIEFSLNKDFASFKNNLKSKCTGDWIFQIDADEYLDPWLIQVLHSILEQNPTTELFSIPRINTVKGLTQEHIAKWGWNVNEKGMVNFPDYQNRIIKNLPHIKWINKVHEKIIGHTSFGFFPLDEEYCILHHKTIERQEIQNQLYNTI